MLILIYQHNSVLKHYHILNDYECIQNKDKMENRSTRKREERFFVNAIVFISYQKSDPLHLPDLGRCKRFHSGSDRHDQHRSGHPDVPHAVSLILPEQR